MGSGAALPRITDVPAHTLHMWMSTVVATCNTRAAAAAKHLSLCVVCWAETEACCHPLLVSRCCLWDSSWERVLQQGADCRQNCNSCPRQHRPPVATLWLHRVHRTCMVPDTYL
jgi:hypothetical protein